MWSLSACEWMPRRINDYHADIQLAEQVLGQPASGNGRLAFRRRVQHRVACMFCRTYCVKSFNLIEREQQAHSGGISAGAFERLAA